MMKRLLDLFLCMITLIILGLPLLGLFLAVKLTSRGPALHWSKRVGKNNTIFLMPKLRSMVIETPEVATHLLSKPEQYLTPIGGFIRKTSLDELPQVLSVLKGDMSFVGPRPALFNQDDLCQLRTDVGVHNLKPGITGWAQINGRDDSPIPLKVKHDQFYLENQTLFLDIKIIFLTALKVLKRDNVTH